MMLEHHIGDATAGYHRMFFVSSRHFVIALVQAPVEMFWGEGGNDEKRVRSC